MRCFILVVVPLLVVALAAALLLLAFKITSFGIIDDQYGDFLAWIIIGSLTVFTAIIVFFARACFGPLHFYPLCVLSGGMLVVFNFYPIGVSIILGAISISLGVLELACQAKRQRRRSMQAFKHPATLLPPPGG